MDVKSLIFDMDGLLIDSEELYHKASFDICAIFGKVPTDDVFTRCMGQKLAHSMAVYVEMMDLPVSPEELLSMMHERMVRDINDNLKMMPGATDILKFYHKKIPMALATGSSTIILDAVLKKTQMAEYFDVIVSADVVDRGKPDPAIFLHAAKKLGVEPQSAVIFEDAQNGVIAGHAAGAYVIAVPNRFTLGADFSKADIVVSNLFQAKEQIETLRR